MKLLLSAACLLICLATFSQSRITGTIRSEKDGATLAFASVFLSQTTLGDRTTEQGHFTVRNIPNGRYELIVSYLGYETLVVPLALQDTTLTLNLRLKPKAGQLGEVVIRSDPDRERWLATFRETFLGTSRAARACRITNENILDLHYDQDHHQLTGSSDGMLIVDNPTLGYRVKYVLQGYVNDFGRGYVLYYGFPQFEEMKAKNRRQQAKWEERRLLAYRGSSMHFMRSLMNKRLKEDGFQVNKIVRVERKNTAAQRAPGDTAQRVLVGNRQPVFSRYADYLYTGEVSYDSIYHKPVQGTGIVLHFTNYLQVVYKNEKEAFEYLQFKGRRADKRYAQTSLVHLFVPEVGVDANGNVDAPADVVFEGYWGWEKVAEMVPLDYKEPVK
ncbi:carboxypeptidase-like regulatory domain-containing protein [Chitinophaga horti]|uniref:Carboxypeptidase-like regulatory domain-containing protein n=1 Tax=Chitinophaga horti TaxID=2920382 RepID=A0ABY6J6R8_9BACT|nr:carboxypeptidase-like regulatory domain-containing protein [Chitinophaga horti]UYQ93849.1 carboxypeptidase-like regulatory domain-containing protein [Chitinophaga horti]